MSERTDDTGADVDEVIDRLTEAVEGSAGEGSTGDESTEAEGAESEAVEEPEDEGEGDSAGGEGEAEESGSEAETDEDDSTEDESTEESEGESTGEGGARNEGEAEEEPAGDEAEGGDDGEDGEGDRTGDEFDVHAARDVGRDLASDLTGAPLDGIVEVEKLDEAGWRVVAEVIERRAVPDTQDILGRYVITLEDDGSVRGYGRVARYRRGDVGEQYAYAAEER